MLLRDDIQEILDGLDINEVMTINYDGFYGRGINGLGHKYACIKNNYTTNSWVEYTEGYDNEKTKTSLIYLKLKDNYIKATYMRYRKDRYDKKFLGVGKEYTVIIPYDRISSIDINIIKSF